MVFVGKLSGMRWVYYHGYLFKKNLQTEFTAVFVPKLSRLWCVIYYVVYIQNLAVYFSTTFYYSFPNQDYYRDIYTQVTGVYFQQLHPPKSNLSWCLWVTYQVCNAYITMLSNKIYQRYVSNYFFRGSKLEYCFCVSFCIYSKYITVLFT